MPLAEDTTELIVAGMGVVHGFDVFAETPAEPLQPDVSVGTTQHAYGISSVKPVTEAEQAVPKHAPATAPLPAATSEHVDVPEVSSTHFTKYVSPATPVHVTSSLPLVDASGAIATSEGAAG